MTKIFDWKLYTQNMFCSCSSCFLTPLCLFRNSKGKKGPSIYALFFFNNVFIFFGEWVWPLSIKIFNQVTNNTTTFIVIAILVPKFFVGFGVYIDFMNVIGWINLSFSTPKWLILFRLLIIFIYGSLF